MRSDRVGVLRGCGVAAENAPLRGGPMRCRGGPPTRIRWSRRRGGDHGPGHGSNVNGCLHHDDCVGGSIRRGLAVRWNMTSAVADALGSSPRLSARARSTCAAPGTTGVKLEGGFRAYRASRPFVNLTQDVPTNESRVCRIGDS